MFESDGNEPANINLLLAQLESFETSITGVYDDKLRKQITATFPFDTDETFNVDGEQWNWSKHSFYNVPVIGVVSNLSKLQSEVRQMENQTLIYLISRPEASNPPS